MNQTELEETTAVRPTQSAGNRQMGPKRGKTSNWFRARETSNWSQARKN